MANSPEKDKGKCVSCGYLSKRSRTGVGHPSPVYYEVSDEERHATPLFFKRWSDSGKSVTTDFACFRGCADLPKEISPRSQFQIAMADSGEFYRKSHRDKSVSLDQAARDMLESLMLP